MYVLSLWLPSSPPLECKSRVLGVFAVSQTQKWLLGINVEIAEERVPYRSEKTSVKSLKAGLYASCTNCSSKGDLASISEFSYFCFHASANA